MIRLRKIQVVNSQRAKDWHAGGEQWTGSDWGNAAAGEMGEACNVVKKLRRLETGAKWSAPLPRSELVTMLGEEIADTILYLLLLGDHYGVDVESAVVRKFNLVSEREGFSHHLDAEGES